MEMVQTNIYSRHIVWFVGANRRIVRYLLVLTQIVVYRAVNRVKRDDADLGIIIATAAAAVRM